MTDRIRRTAVLILGLSVLSISCGRPAPQPPAVPSIGDARDARGADPCALLSAAQLAAHGLDGTGTPAAAEEGPHCRWRGTAGALDVTLYTGGGGLSTLAANSEPTTTRVRLAGYPALETFTGLGEFCQYDVGVADRQVVSAALDAPAPGSCDVLQHVVPELLGNLPAAGPSAPTTTVGTPGR
jgi:Protein of unknown function (DUF3558)